MRNQINATKAIQVHKNRKDSCLKDVLKGMCFKRNISDVFSKEFYFMALEASGGMRWWISMSIEHLRGRL